MNDLCRSVHNTNHNNNYNGNDNKMELELAASYHLPTDLSVCAVKNAAANAATAASNALAAASAAVSDAQKFGGRGSSWSREETSLLLDVYEVEMAKEDANFDKNSASLMVPKFQSIYRTISDLLRVQGFERSPMQVRERLKRLKRDVREHKQGEFTARVSAIVGRSPYTRPSLIQQAAILNTEKMRSFNNNSITSNNLNNNSSERSLSETFYPADMLSTEMSYPDDDEPSTYLYVNSLHEIVELELPCRIRSFWARLMTLLIIACVIMLPIESMHLSVVGLAKLKDLSVRKSSHAAYQFYYFYSYLSLRCTNRRPSDLSKRFETSDTPLTLIYLFWTY